MDQDLPALLREHGLRVTSQRLVILEILFQPEARSQEQHAGESRHGHVHFTAQEVFQLARPRLPGLNAATVYRVLESLHQAHVVDVSGAPGAGEVNYSLRNPESRHIHLACRSCGQERSLRLDPALRMAEDVASQTGFRVDVDHLTLSGLCSACQSGVEAEA